MVGQVERVGRLSSVVGREETVFGRWAAVDERQAAIVARSLMRDRALPPFDRRPTTDDRRFTDEPSGVAR